MFVRVTCYIDGGRDATRIPRPFKKVFILFFRLMMKKREKLAPHDRISFQHLDISIVKSWVEMRENALACKWIQSKTMWPRTMYDGPIGQCVHTHTHSHTVFGRRVVCLTICHPCNFYIERERKRVEGRSRFWVVIHSNRFGSNFYYASSCFLQIFLFWINFQGLSCRYHVWTH